MANSYPGSGTVILDDLKVCTNIRLQPAFVSYGEHIFMNLESAHGNTYLPVLSFSRAGCTYGSIGLERASNSDCLGSYTESEMIIGTQTNVATSIKTNGQRRLIITNSGNVGIGCTTPTNTLEVNGTGRFTCTVNIGTSASSTSRFQLNFENWNASNSYPYITFQNPTANCRHGIGINTSNDFVIGRATGVNCNFAHNDFVIVNSTGNIGISCTSPGSKLTIGGTLTTTDTITTTSGTVNTIISWNASVGIIGTDTNHGLQIRTCGTERIRITCNGEIGINTTSPGSYKLYVNGAFYSAGSSCEYKTQICQYNTDSCMFMKLTPVTYQYKDEWSYLGKELKSGTQIGLIAEDVAEVYPELAILKDEDDQKIVRNVDYEKLSIILLSELQKLRAEVDELKTK